MADCTCADPTAVVRALSGGGGGTSVSQATSDAAEKLDETLHGKAHNGEHGMLDTIRFCHWAAPEYGPKGERAWTNFWRAAQLAIALLNAQLQGEIADKMEDLADGYYQQAKFKWDRFNEKYKPLEIDLLNEVSTVPEPEMNCVDDRGRAESATNPTYALMLRHLQQRAKAMRVCIDDTQMRNMEYGRNLMLVDTENFNLRDDTWFTDFKSDQRWNRRANVLNLGRNLGSIAMQYGDIARATMKNVGAQADRAAGALVSALGYYGARFDTMYSTTYLTSGGNAGNIAQVGTNSGAANAASGGF